MNTTQQLYLTIAVAPILSLVIVLAGYIVQNVNLNARVAEIKGDIRDLLNAHTAEIRAEIRAVQTAINGVRETLQAELNGVRSEIAKNHSELLSKLVEERFRSR